VLFAVVAMRVSASLRATPCRVSNTMSEASIVAEAKRARAPRAALPSRAREAAPPSARRGGVAVARGAAIAFEIVLRDESGAILDRSAPGAPFRCVLGEDELLAGLERALLGARAGETLRVRLAPEDAHGARQDLPLLRVPLARLPGGPALRIGAALEVLDPIVGVRSCVWLHSIDGEYALVQREHPLAGRALEVELTLLSVELPAPAAVRESHAIAASKRRSTVRAAVRRAVRDRDEGS
jgi:FKBP-type peptidyl-prolyl cis-trans isomerase SlyD